MVLFFSMPTRLKHNLHAAPEKISHLIYIKKIMSKRLIKLKSFMIQMAENFREKNKKLNNFLSFV